MDAALPPSVAAALDALAQGRSGRRLAEKAQAISTAYRAGSPSSGIIRDADDALAYALTRLPATYAAAVSALDALARRAPAFRPARLLDVGCGPGSASLAALQVLDRPASLRLVDGNQPLLDLARRLLDGGPTAELQRVDLAAADLGRADVVLAGYVLTELPDAPAFSLAERLWAATDGALVIVEPGTPRGWARLMSVRSMLINAGAAIAAPCPHAAPCPVTPPDWCHFSRRLPRLRAHRLAKGAEAPFEDEKFAYLAATRPDVTLIAAAPRILAPPRRDKVEVALKLCAPSGDLVQRRVPTRDRAALRTVRRADWGDALED